MGRKLELKQSFGSAFLFAVGWGAIVDYYYPSVSLHGLTIILRGLVKRKSSEISIPAPQNFTEC